MVVPRTYKLVDDGVCIEAAHATVTDLVAMVVDAKVRLDVVIIAEILAVNDDKLEHTSGNPGSESEMM